MTERIPAAPPRKECSLPRTQPGLGELLGWRRQRSLEYRGVGRVPGLQPLALAHVLCEALGLLLTAHRGSAKGRTT